jgi:hypothetical protein
MITRGAFRGTITGLLIGLGAIGGLACSCIPVHTAAAETSTVLVVDGALADGKPAAFDLAQLKSLPSTKVKTTTPWSEGDNTFEGVRVRDLLDRLGAKGSAVLVAAVDDYQSLIPMEDIRDYDVIIASAMNGKPLPLDDKGPLWIIYPFSAHAVLQKDLYFARSVWQLNRLTVR